MRLVSLALLGLYAGCGSETTVAEIANRAPTAATPVVSPGELYIDTEALCELGAFDDADGDSVLVTFSWLINGEVVEGMSQDTLPAGTAERGDAVSCAVLPTDGDLDGPLAISDTVPVVNRSPTADPEEAVIHGRCVAVGPSSVLENDVDADGDALIVELVDRPLYGDVQLNEDGTYVYTPDGFVDEDRFTYTVSDGFDVSEPIEVVLRNDLVGAIEVNGIQDAISDGKCSLREAIEAANTDTAVDGCPAGSGADTVIFNVIGANVLRVKGAGEDHNLTGDLDVRSTIDIVGCGTTIIDGNAMDRVFHVHEQGDLRLDGVTVQNGLSSGQHPIGGDTIDSGWGGGIASSGDLTLIDVQVIDNEVQGGHGNDGERYRPGRFSKNSRSGGAGGGAAMGAGVFIELGTLTASSGALERCAFIGNRAVGGDGGRGWPVDSYYSASGGAGGGASGGAGGKFREAPEPGGFGGGGGGGGPSSPYIVQATGRGATGGFGGGGGGGGAEQRFFGNPPSTPVVGGSGGFGGGDGGSDCCTSGTGGGGGAGFGGGLFVLSGTVDVSDCLFEANEVAGGAAGLATGGGTDPQSGGGFGAAWFQFDASESNAVIEGTYRSNEATTDGANGFVFRP
ncbi:MAG: Ig-like domain-containing protein [Myxococcota bacterium]